MSEKCNRAVYRHGELVGVFPWTGEEAESYRKHATNSKWLYDWYFAAGRVVMRRIRRGPIASIGRFLRVISGWFDR